jgi:hypothetical protein
VAAMKNYIKNTAILLVLAFALASCSSYRTYPNYNSSETSRYYKKKNKKYGKSNQRNIPIKRNYKIKD